MKEEQKTFWVVYDNKAELYLTDPYTLELENEFLEDAFLFLYKEHAKGAAEYLNAYETNFNGLISKFIIVEVQKITKEVLEIVKEEE